MTKTEKPKFDDPKPGQLLLKDIPIGKPILVHYKDGTSEWFEWMGFTVDREEAKRTANAHGFTKEGFVMFGIPIRDTPAIIGLDGRSAVRAVFPHTVKSMESED